MKSVSRLSLLGISLFACAATLLAQNDGSFASGQFQTSSGATIRFNAREHSRGSDVRGEMTFSDPAGLTINVEIDCLLVSGNQAVMSGTIVESSMPELVGGQSLLVVEDNGQGKNAAVSDRFTWVPSSPADCQALPPSSYVLEDVTDGHIHIKASNAPF